MEKKEFTIIRSQLDNIPEGHPVVFISYSWDSDEHKAWVKKLSDDLRSKYAVYTLLDQYNQGGYDLISFMRQGLKRADRVLMIGTPNYKKKSESNQGGVKFEDQLISNEIYHKMGSSKFIPILRSGQFDTSFTAIVETNSGYKMDDEEQYEEVLYNLAADLWNNPVNAAPTLGPTPTFAKKNVSETNGAFIKEELSVERFVLEIKRLLSTPNSDIAFTEMIESEGKIAFEKIAQKADYNFEINTESFREYKEYHLKAVERLLAASVIVIRHGTLKQQENLVDVMVKLCLIPKTEYESSVIGTSNLHLFAATFLFHTVGVSCFKYGNYRLLPILMKRSVPAGNALSSGHVYSLAHLAGMNHWQPDVLSIYMDASWYYPYSELVSRTLYPLFKDYCLSDDEYKDYFAIWEHMFSLMYVYYGSSFFKDKDIFPIGLFLSERIIRNEMIGGRDTYNQFFANASLEKEEWEPLKQGLFDGNYSEFAFYYNKAQDYYKYNRRF